MDGSEFCSGIRHCNTNLSRLAIEVVVVVVGVEVVVTGIDVGVTASLRPLRGVPTDPTQPTRSLVLVVM